MISHHNSYQYIFSDRKETRYQHLYFHKIFDPQCFANKYLWDTKWPNLSHNICLPVSLHSDPLPIAADRSYNKWKRSICLPGYHTNKLHWRYDRQAKYHHGLLWRYQLLYFENL